MLKGDIISECVQENKTKLWDTSCGIRLNSMTEPCSEQYLWLLLVHKVTLLAKAVCVNE